MIERVHQGQLPSAGVGRVLGSVRDFVRAQLNVHHHNVSPSLAGIFTLLWYKRWPVILATVVCAIIGFVAAIVQPAKYVATMVVIPNVENQLNMGSSSGMMGGLSSLVSGSPLQKPERVTPFQQFMAVIYSKPAAELLESEGPFLRHLYPNRWDDKRQTWKPQPWSLVSILKSAVKSALRIPDRPYPGAENIAQIIRERVNISSNEKNSIYTFTFADRDPKFAAAFLKAIYDSGETLLLRQARAIASARVRQTERELDDTSVESSRRALMDVLTVFHAREIEANVGSPYAAQIVYGPISSDYPSEPNVLFYILGGLLFGLFISSLYYLIAAVFAGMPRGGDVVEGTFGAITPPGGRTTTCE